MNIICKETYKLFSNRKLLSLTLMLVMICLIMTIREPANVFYSDSAIRALDKDISGYTDKEKLDFLEQRVFEYEVYTALELPSFMNSITEDSRSLKYIDSYKENGVPLIYTGHLWLEKRLYDDTYKRLNEIISYDDYLDKIENQAEQMLAVSIFAEKDSFEYRNIIKAVSEYDKLRGIKPIYGLSYGLTSATDNLTADIFVLVSILMAASTLIIEEKEKGLTKILRSVKYGGTRLASAKLGAMLIWCFFCIILFFGSNLIAGALRFDIGDLSRPVQSLDGFLGCTLRVTVLQYLFIHFISKTISFFVLSTVLVFVFTMAGSFIPAYGLSGFLIALEYLLYAKIPHASIYSPLKYINIAALTRTSSIFHTYSSVNFAGYPVNLITVSGVSMLVLSGLFIVLTIGCIKNPRFGSWSLRITTNPIHKKLHKRISVSLILHELFKTFIINKAIIIMLILAAWQYSGYTSYIKPYDEDDGYYKNYTEQVGGTFKQATADFIGNEQNQFNKLHTAMAELENKYNTKEITNIQYIMSFYAIKQSLAPENAFNRLVNEVNYIKNENPAAQIVYDSGYRQLLAGSGYDNDMNIVLITMLSLVFLTCMMYSAGKASQQIISAAKFGHEKLFAVRCFICLILAVIVFVFANLPFLMNIVKAYGLSGLSAPIQSIALLRDSKYTITILEYLVTMYGLRLFFTVLSSILMLSISRLARNAITAFAASFVIFVAPAMLYFLGVSGMSQFLFNALVGVNAILQ